MSTHFLISLLVNVISIYSFQTTSINKGAIDFNNYQGKKILLVNVATQGQYAGQITELNELYDYNENDLIIIGFASNSFGNELHTNEQLNSYLTDSLDIHFPVIEISDVTGENAHPVYKWLANAEENGIMNATVVCDFQKFLFNENGTVMGIFRDEISPLSPVLTNLINQNQ